MNPHSAPKLNQLARVARPTVMVTTTETMPMRMTYRDPRRTPLRVHDDELLRQDAVTSHAEEDAGDGGLSFEAARKPEGDHDGHDGEVLERRSAEALEDVQEGRVRVELLIVRVCDAGEVREDDEDCAPADDGQDGATSDEFARVLALLGESADGVEAEVAEHDDDGRGQDTMQMEVERSVLR